MTKEKRTMRNQISIIAAAVLILTVLTLSATATERPLKINGSTVLTPTETPGVFTMDGAGTGTHVGDWTNTGYFVLNPFTGEGSGTIDLVAANGDQLHFIAGGTADLLTGNVVATYSIDGGTGRFDGATGSGDFVGQLTFTPGGAIITYTVTGTIDY
jgi:hypothetical protein